MKHFLFTFMIGLLLLITPITAFGKNGLGLGTYLQRTIDQANLAYTPWQEFEFGKARLVADRIGLKNINNLILGLEIQVNNGWYLSQPSFEIADPDLDLLVYPNFRTGKEIQGPWDTDFEGNLLFPFFLKGPFAKDLHLLLQSQLNACHKELGCRTGIALHDLSLPLDKEGASLWYGSLNMHLTQVAFPGEEVGINFQTEQKSNDSLHLRLTFPKKVSEVEIQGAEITSMTQPFIRDNIFDCVLNLSNPIQERDVIPLAIRSSIGCFTLDIIVQNQPILPLPQKLPFSVAFWSGLLLFLLTPAWCYWFNPLTLMQTDFRKEVRQVQFLCLVGLLLLGVAWKLDILTEWYQCPFIKGLTIILLVVLFFKPFPKWYFLPLLFVVLPKPFWLYIKEISDSAKIGLLIWWGICILLPFNIWILSQKHILKFFKETQDDLSYQLCVRLPYIILMGWIILSLFGVLK